jgi:trigger factor
MQTKINDKGVLTKEIHVTFTKDEVNKKYNEKLKAIAPTIALPGYRKGKVSPRVIEMKYKDNILDEVRQDLAKEGLKSIGEQVKSYGDYDFTNMGEIKLNTEFSYQVSTSVFPDVQLPDYKGLKYQKIVSDITDAEINETIQGYLTNFSELETLAEGVASEEKDMVSFAYTITVGKEEIKKDDNATCPAELLLVRGADVDDASKKLLVGKKNGETTKLSATVSETFENEKFRGKKADISITVKDIKRLVVPALSDELANKFGVESADKMKQIISGQLTMRKTQQAEDTKKAKLLNDLLSKINFEVPDQLLKTTIQNLKNEQQHDHEHVHDENCDHDHGHEEEHVHGENCDHDHDHGHEMAHDHVHGEDCDHDHDHGEEDHEHDKPVSEQETRDQLKREILLEMIANKESIQVTQADFDGFITRLASMYKMKPAELAKNLNPQMANAMSREIRWNKALDLVSSLAVIEA